jgi:hypothetical protein
MALVTQVTVEVTVVTVVTGCQWTVVTVETGGDRWVKGG